VLRRHKKKGLLVHPVTFKNCADGLKTKSQCAADSVFSCGYRSFAILKNGMVFGWGLNNYGQLGVGDYENRFRPELVEGVPQCVQIDGGIHHTIALSADGTCYGFGRGDSGQLALAQGPMKGITLPVAIPSLASVAGPVASIGCGTNHNLAITRGGKLFVWGFGEMQQLGNGECRDEHFPIEVPIAGGPGVALLQVSGGGQHSALLARGAK
jgi:regulator of chromosome condensation